MLCGVRLTLLRGGRAWWLMQVKFLDVDKETSRLVVSHRKAVVDTQIHE